MKLERLAKILELRGRTKLFVLTDDFCLCGYASHPLWCEAVLRVDVGASVRVVLSSGELMREPTCGGTLFLSAAHKTTRRLQTHRRHLQGYAVREEYFAAAKAL